MKIFMHYVICDVIKVERIYEHTYITRLLVSGMLRTRQLVKLTP